MNKREAENEIVKDMIEKLEVRHGDLPEEHQLDDVNHIVEPPETLEEISYRINRASKLSLSSTLRIGGKFLRETDPNLQ